jgi:ABC-2 type transport system ATP-binding protein
LQDFSLTARKGEVVGLLGANGAGKTTALRLLAGILPPVSGVVQIDGVTLHNHRAAQGWLGYLPENPGLYPDITATEYLRFLAAAQGCDAQAIAAAAARTACAEVMHQPIETLSKGWRQRVYLAGVLLHEPKVLILDEPTDGLDPLQKSQMYSLLGEIKKDCAIVLSTHLLDEAETLCDRLSVIAGGRCVAEGTPKKLQGKDKTFFAAFCRLSASGETANV